MTDLSALGIVGTKEVAERLGVSYKTVEAWRSRAKTRGADSSAVPFPEPDLVVGRALLWEWATIEVWAKATGRLSVTGGSRLS